MAAGRRHLGGHGAAPRPGDLVDGIVSRVASGALFLDIGTGRDARLRLARGDELYSEGDELRGLRIAAADGEAGRTELRLPEERDGVPHLSLRAAGRHTRTLHGVEDGGCRRVGRANCSIGRN